MHTRSSLCVELAVYGHFVPWSFRSKDKGLSRSLTGEKNESMKQICGSERNNFLYLERNDHGTKRPDTELAISCHDLQYESCKPVIYLFHGSGPQIICNRLMLISKGFNLLFRYSFQARKTFTDHTCFLWNSVSFSFLDFVHCGRILETCTFIEFIFQALGQVYTLKSK